MNGYKISVTFQRTIWGTWFVDYEIFRYNDGVLTSVARWTDYESGAQFKFSTYITYTYPPGVYEREYKIE